MEDLVPFGLTVALVAVAGLLAVWSNPLSERIRVPAPAVFLVAAAIASDLVPRLSHVSVTQVQRVVTVMLVLLLFDGGLHIGQRRFRTTAGPVLLVGVLGTVLTAGGVALVAHEVLDSSWRTALLLGVALSPTDPAVVFSVLGRREVQGRSGTLLEGESGANDPVGIAAMAALLGAGTTSGLGAVWHGTAEFALQMVVGLVVGLAGAWLLSQAMRRIPLPSGALYPLQTLLGSGVVFGAATVAHGSGFLAVFVAGIYLGDLRAPYKAEIERFHSSLASLAEIVAFTLLGLTVSVHFLFSTDAWIEGLVIAVVLALVLRPLLVGPLLLAVRMRPGERLFVMWAGLKGAVPILLGTYILTSGEPRATELYEVVVMVVAFSVVVQGGLVPLVAARAGVPMRIVDPEPWALGMRFRDRPSGLRRFHVAPGAAADGATIGDLDIGEDSWISMVSRNGSLVNLSGRTELQAGDEVLLLTDSDADVDPGPVFTGG